MRYATLVLLTVGTVLLGFVFTRVDLRAAAVRLHDIGPRGIAVLVALLFAAWLTQAAISSQTVASRRARPHRIYAFWKVWMVGEAFNTITPLASFGGEPVKAALLKKHDGVDLRDATAALVLAQTINIGSL